MSAEEELTAAAQAYAEAHDPDHQTEAKLAIEEVKVHGNEAAGSMIDTLKGDDDGQG